MRTLDVRGLKEEEVLLLKKLVELLRARSTPEEHQDPEAETITYHTWPLGVKSNTTREEIYDNL